LINAYPGFGKSRLAAKLAAEWRGRALLMTRSRLEAMQLCGYVQEEGVEDAVLMLGREALCPLGAENKAECMSLRIGLRCRARSSTSRIVSCNPLSLYEIGICPYEYSRALSRQSKVVITTHAYLSNFELYSHLVPIAEGALVIIDEFHNIVTGMDVSLTLKPREIRVWASRGNPLALRILDMMKRGSGFMLLSDVDIDEVLRGSGSLGDKVMSMLDHYGSDLWGVLIDGDGVSLRWLSTKPLLSILRRCSRGVFLTASIPRSLLSITRVLGLDVDYVSYDDVPPEYRENLRIICITGIRLTYRSRLDKHYIKLVRDMLRSFIESSPLVGGIGIFFPSKDYMRAFLERASPLHPGTPTYVLDEEPEAVVAHFRERSKLERSILVSHAQSIAGEGINFLGNELVGVAMVGFPLPQFNKWNEVKSRFYASKGISGFKAAFIFPAISITIQVLGRLTRDLLQYRKIALLIDDRFKVYSKYMPTWIRNNMRMARREDLSRLLVNQ